MMKKKVVSMLLALTVMSSMVACGGKNEESRPANSEKQISQEQEADSAEEDSTEDESAEEEPTEDESAEETALTDDISNWSAYMGTMDDGGTVYYCYNGEGTRAAFIYLSADATMSVSIMGDYSYDEEEGIGYIMDDVNGVVLTDMTVDNGDGTYTVDLGAQGTALIAESDPQEVIDAMDTIQAGTQDMTAEFVASLEAASASSGAETVDVSNWECYAGVMEDGETYALYAFNEDGSRAAFIALSPDQTQSISIIGDSSVDENGTIYITDDNSGLTFACVPSETGDGGYILDYGELGQSVVYPVDSQEVIDAMDTIQAGTVDITEDFISSLG